MTTGLWNRLATLSASQAPHSGGTSDSAGWSVACKAKDVLLPEAPVTQAYLRRFVHLSIRLALVLEDRIPAYEMAESNSATVGHAKTRSPNQQRRIAYRNWLDPGAARSCRACVLGTRLAPGPDQLRTQMCRLPKPTCPRTRREGC